MAKWRNGYDYYVVSGDTGLIYYMQGYEYNGEKYYRVTEELSSDYDYSVYLNINEVLVNDIIFSPSSKKYTNKPITVEVKVPINCKVTSVEANNSVVVGEATQNSAYIIYVVNSTSIGTNYSIVVKYIDENNISKESIYIVDKYDNLAPKITVGDITSKTLTGGVVQYYLQNVNISDEFSGIDYVKYTNTVVEDITYFKKSGELVSPEVTILSLGQLNTYTIYVVDNAGNYTLLSKQ